jgi:predicted dienelactone hydrolase
VTRSRDPRSTTGRNDIVQIRRRSLIGALAAVALASSSLVAGTTTAQAVGVSSYDTSIVTDATTVYYPSGLATGQKLPFVLMLQGAEVDKQYYSSYAEQVAAHGLIVIVENHDNVLLGDNYAGETQVSNTATWAVFENLRTGSPLKGHIDTGKMGLLGHSFGGVAGLFASSGVCVPPFCLGLYLRPAALKAAAFYGTNSSIGGVTLPTALNGVPVALINGSLDGNATLAETQTSYDLMFGAKRALVTLHGANHYGITNIDNPPPAAPDLTAPTLAQATAVSEVALWSAMWIKAQLGDPTALAFVTTTGDAGDPYVTVQQAG